MLSPEACKWIVHQIEEERRYLRERRITLYNEIAKLDKREIECIDALQELGACGTIEDVRHTNEEE